MNTKSLLIILIIAAFPFKVSTSVKQHLNLNVEYLLSTHMGICPSATVTITDQGRDSFPLDSLWNFNCMESAGNNSNDDGKTHHIHFERFNEHKKRLIFCLIGKMILVVSHLCSLLSLFFHY